MCLAPFKYFLSTPSFFIIANNCLKCNICSDATTYNALVKSYVFILYKNVAISLVIYILDPLDFSTNANPNPSFSKSITFAPSETCVIPFSSKSSIIFFISLEYADSPL